MITSIGIYLAFIGLISYFIWFIYTNKCELESNLMKALTADPVYTIDDITDLVISAIAHLLAIPFLIFISLAFIWPIVIIGMIILFFYRKKYNL